MILDCPENEIKLQFTLELIETRTSEELIRRKLTLKNNEVSHIACKNTQPGFVGQNSYYHTNSICRLAGSRSASFTGRISGNRRTCRRIEYK